MLVLLAIDEYLYAIGLTLDGNRRSKLGAGAQGVGPLLGPEHRQQVLVTQLLFAQLKYDQSVSQGIHTEGAT